MPGEEHNGDGYIIATFDAQGQPIETRLSAGARSSTCVHLDCNEAALIAIVDGTGHGAEASLAAQTILARMAQSPQQDLELLLRQCHIDARATRGAAAALLRLDATPQASILGLGSITAQSTLLSPGQTKHAAMAAGALGFNAPQHLLLDALPVSGNHILAVWSDGIPRALALESIELVERMNAEATAEAILEEHGSAQDDASVIIVRPE